MIAALLGLLVAAAAGAPEASAAPQAKTAPEAAAAERQQRFDGLLRSYPLRPVAESHRLVEALVDEGPFAERDRALYWLGSARLSAKDLAGARGAFARLRREHQGSPWIERAWLGEAEACGLERDYGCSLRWLAQAQAAADPAVRELGRLSTMQVHTLLERRRFAAACLLFAAGVLAFLAISIARHRRSSAFSIRPLPTEVTVLLPVLGMLALLSIRQDPAPRAAVLEICVAGAVFVTLSGLRLRAAAPGAVGRVLQVAATGLALAACVYAAIWRADLIAMVMETVRAGPE